MKLPTPLLAAMVLLVPLHGAAAPADYIKMPAITEGEAELDFKAGSASKSGQPRASAASLGLGYGVNSWWLAEFNAYYTNELNQDTPFDSVELENKFLLTPGGRYPVDIGLLLEIERPNNHADGWDVLWGPLFQTRFGQVQFNLNLLLHRVYDAVVAGDTDLLYQWQLRYRSQSQWQLRYRSQSQWQFGLQGFGDMGAVDHWAPADAQSHRLGPAVFGKLALGEGEALKYNAAWLLGASKAAPDHTLRFQVEYEF